MEYNDLKATIEGAIFASGEPIEAEKISSALNVDPEKVESAISEIYKEYSESNHGIELLKLGDKYQFSTKSCYSSDIRKILSTKKNAPLSQAALEVLAVIAFNEPVTKSFVEQVRGVDCSGVISTLLQKNLIEESGRLDLPGHPLLYCTTENFLRCFDLSSLEELKNIKDPESPVSD